MPATRYSSAFRYSEPLAQAGIEPSAARKGNSDDNALAETINGLCKAEAVHRLSAVKTREAVEISTLAWVNGFNHHRSAGPIG